MVRNETKCDVHRESEGNSMVINEVNKKTYSSSIVLIGNFSPVLFQSY